MKKLILLFATLLFSLSLNADTTFSTADAQNAMHYYLKEVERDPLLTHAEQDDMVYVFKAIALQLSPETASQVTELLLHENRARVFDLFVHAELDADEMEFALAEYDLAIKNVKRMDVETARQMLFFITELKLHREMVYQFGIELGCPSYQLLRHDLCKLHSDQFEGYARYFRGGRQKEDKPAQLAAWEQHQYAEHHHQSYRKEGFDFDTFSEERLRHNMFEAAADVLAATKQRGGIDLTGWLLHQFPKQNPHPRLIPYFEEALIKAHGLYLESERDPLSNSIFKGMPCWNEEIAKVFEQLKKAS